MNILLLNPPGNKIYTRDYYCSKVSKSDYFYHPIDLLMLSGTLSRRHRVEVLDAIAEHLSREECGRRILDKNYDAVIFLTGSVSWKEDAEFLRDLKAAGRFLMVGTGDILLEDYSNLLRQNDFLDGVILDFTTEDILSYLEGRLENVKNMAFRRGSEIIDKAAPREFQKEFAIETPRYELFPNARYRYPFVIRHPFATVLTDYGCPFKCHFCVMNSIGFKFRNMEGVLKDIKYVKELGFEDIYFGDQTFGARPERLKAICDFMINEKMDMGWVCWFRVDLANEDTLKLMKRAGCHTILFGVETANDDILRANGKGFTAAQVKKAFALCRQLGLRTLGTFIFGLPGEDKESCLKTIAFAKQISADFASFNVLIPRMNTNIRQQAITNKWISEDVKIMDQSGNFAVMGNDKMTKEEILWLRDRAIKEFYLRPSYILRRLFGVRTLFELKLMFINGLSIFENLFNTQ